MKAQAVSSKPRLRPDDQNPDFCFAEIFLNVPWRQLSDLPWSDEDCIARFRDLRGATTDESLRKDETSPTAYTRCIGGQPCLRGEHALPGVEWRIGDVTFDDAHEGSAQQAGQHDVSTSSMPFTPRHDYSTDDVRRAETFMAQVLRPFLKDRRKQTHDRDDNFSSGGTAGRDATQSYLYPVDLKDSNMSDEQWSPFAVCMSQSRRRLAAMKSGTRCAPMQMALHGEGGSGKSWLIRHIVKDVHNVFGDTDTSVRSSRRVLLMAHQGTAAFNIKGSTLCSALALPVRLRGSSWCSKYVPLVLKNPNKRKSLQE